MNTGGAAYTGPIDTEDMMMKHIKTIAKAGVKKPAGRKACGECQTSCQSACKTSCTVANQKCEYAEK